MERPPLPEVADIADNDDVSRNCRTDRSPESGPSDHMGAMIYTSGRRPKSRPSCTRT